MTAVLLIAFGYLAGAFSPSVHLGRALTGVDVREHGSGNPGTTNSFRVLGRRIGVLVLVLDVLKGFVPVLLARLLSTPTVTVLVALAALAGHNYSVFLKGRGGKGVATGAGTLAAMTPLILLVLLGVFGIVLAVTGIVSVASLSAVVLFPVLTVATGQPAAYIVFSVVGAAIVVFAHRSNLVRLARGREARANLPWRRPRADAPSEHPPGTPGNG